MKKVEKGIKPIKNKSDHLSPEFDGFFARLKAKLKKIFGFSSAPISFAKRLEKRITVDKPTFLLDSVETYKDFKKMFKLYSVLKGKYSTKIIKKQQIVSIGDYSPALSDNIVELDKIYKYFLVDQEVVKVLLDVNLKIKRGDFLVILGPSGSGKSTLLNIVSGIDSANSGNLFVNGYNLNLLSNSSLTDFRRQYVGFIFQQYNLLENLTGQENVEVGEALLPKNKLAVNLQELFQFLEIDTLLEKYPYQLSGGQQQRFSIARALAKNPDILFCDEPTGALDEKMSQKVMTILSKINRHFKTTIILVTHNESYVNIAKTVVRLKDGKIVNVKSNVASNQIK